MLTSTLHELNKLDKLRLWMLESPSCELSKSKSVAAVTQNSLRFIYFLNPVCSIQREEQDEEARLKFRYFVGKPVRPDFQAR